MKENILKIINIILENKSEELKKNISLHMSLRNDFGFDSLDLAEFTVRVEKEYNVDVFADGLVDTINEVINKLKKK